MKYTEETPRPCLWCKTDLRKSTAGYPNDFDIAEAYGPKLVILPKRLRTELIDTQAIQCSNCGLITPGAKTADLAWKYWNDGGHK